MGDAGRLYIPPTCVPAYKSIIRQADLLLPNQFEAELLSDTPIASVADVATAVARLHKNYMIPHVVITSLRLSPTTGRTLPATTTTPEGGYEEVLTVVGSTATREMAPRLFRVDVHAIPAFFSGTGDMFAALMVARLREAVCEVGVDGALQWRSGDEVEARDLPLARSCERVLASMQSVLGKTYVGMQEELKKAEVQDESKEYANIEGGEEGRAKRELEAHLRKTRAAEVRVVRNADDLRKPPDLERFRAQNMEVGKKLGEERQPNELGVTSLGGEPGVGAVHTENDRRWGP